MLQLRLCEPATPTRVERAGRLFADALNALGVSDMGVTLVVENDRLRATLRTRSSASTAGVQSIIDLVRSPVGALSSPELSSPAQPGRSALAEVLAKYARDEQRAKPELWRPGRGGKFLCSLDETFANLMEALAKTAPAGTQRVRGTTYVHTKILRVGRTDERQQHRVRINVDGRPIEVALAEGLATGPFFDAAKSEQVVRVRLRADWLHVVGERPVIHDPLVIGIDEAKEASNGARIIAIAAAQRLVTADELPALLSSIDRSDEDDK
jgi:hypothetical protein